MTGQALTYVEDWRWRVICASFSVLLTAMFTYFLIEQWTAGVSIGAVLASLIVVGFWVVSGMTIIRLVQPLKLVVDEEGFSLSNWPAVVPWRDVEAFKLTYLTFDVWRRRAVYRDKGPGVPQVGWTLKSEVPVPLHRKINMGFAGVAGTIPFSMEGRAADHLVLLEDRRRRYAASDETR